MPPRTYGRGAEGVTLRYTLTDSPLGRLLVAATERGVSAVYLGDADRALEAALREEYPGAVRRRDDAVLAPMVQAILGHLEGRLPRLDLPLDVQATAFQWKVWQALRAIPLGETRSYGAIAKALGRPTGARAVARACATNPVSLVIPCHRVVEANGRLTGYRWESSGSARSSRARRGRRPDAEGPPCLFGPQGLHRIQPGGPARGDPACQPGHREESVVTTKVKESVGATP